MPAAANSPLPTEPAAVAGSAARLGGLPLCRGRHLCSQLAGPPPAHLPPPAAQWQGAGWAAAGAGEPPAVDGCCALLVQGWCKDASCGYAAVGCRMTGGLPALILACDVLLPCLARPTWQLFPSGLNGPRLAEVRFLEAAADGGDAALGLLRDCPSLQTVAVAGPERLSGTVPLGRSFAAALAAGRTPCSNSLAMALHMAHMQALPRRWRSAGKRWQGSARCAACARWSCTQTRCARLVDWFLLLQGGHVAWLL